MPMTFCGVPFLSLREKGRDVLMPIVERWWASVAPELWTFPAYNTAKTQHLPCPGEPNKEKARLNTLVWPVGCSRWAVFHGLVDGTGLATILSTVGSGATAQTLLIDDGIGGSIQPSMYLLGVRPGFTESVQTMWWITLVDKRYYFWLKELNYSFTAGDSWNTLISGLNTAMGITATTATVSTNYGTPNPLRWSVPAVPLPLTMDAVCTTVGLRFIANLDGTYSINKSDNVDSDDQTQFETYEEQVGYGGRSTVDQLVGSIPASVNTAFWGDVQVVQNITLASLALATYSGATGVSGTSAWVMGDAKASDGTGVQTPYATQAAKDYYRWWLSKTDCVFRGVVPWVQTGLEDRTEWEYTPGNWDNSSPEIMGRVSRVMPSDRVITRVVRSNWADRNSYGNRPPVGYSYTVKLTGTNGTAWSASIQVYSSGVIGNGPDLGFGDSPPFYVLYQAGSGTPTVGSIVTATPDPLIPNLWTFTPSSGGSGVTIPVVTNICVVYGNAGSGSGSGGS